MPNVLNYMEDIFKIMQAGVFPEVDQEQKEDETYVGQMTEFEKSVWTWMFQTGKKLEKFLKDVDEKKRNFFSVDDKELSDADYLSTTLRAMRSGFWELIEERLKIDTRKMTTGIRKGYVVITCPMEEKQAEESSETDGPAVVIIGFGSKKHSMEDDMLLGEPEGKPS
jgi:hypothetical protein